MKPTPENITPGIPEMPAIQEEITPSVPHKFVNVTTHSDRKKYGQAQVKKCVNCGCVMRIDQKLRKSYLHGGYITVQLPDCKPSDEFKEMVERQIEAAKQKAQDQIENERQRLIEEISNE